MAPILAPHALYFFDTLSIRIKLSFAFLLIVANDVAFLLSKLIGRYTSSEIMYRSYFKANFTIIFNSSSEYTVPVGLFGFVIRIAFVLVFINFSIVSISGR